MLANLDLFSLPCICALLAYVSIGFRIKNPDAATKAFLTVLLPLAVLAVAVGALTPHHMQVVAICGFFLAATRITDAMRQIPREMW